MADGIFTRYQGSVYVGIRNKWAIFANLGGTAEVHAFVPIMGAKAFFYCQEGGNGFDTMAWGYE